MTSAPSDSTRMREQLVVSLSTTGVSQAARRIARQLRLGSSAELLRLAVVAFVEARKDELTELPEDYITLVEGLRPRDEFRRPSTTSSTVEAA